MDAAALFLVIDDDLDLLDGMARILRRDGHQVIIASTGAEGVRLAGEQQPDIAVVDVLLPDMNGVEVCKHIQAGAQSGNIDTILISSIATTAEDQAEGFRVGVCEYLARPLPNKEFLARVNARLRDKRKRESLKLDRNNAKRISDNEKSQRIELEEELQAIFSTAPICLFLTDGNATLVKTNPALGTIFGGDLQSGIGTPCGIAFNCLHNTDHTAGCGFGSHCSTCGVRSAIKDTFSTGMSQQQVESCLTCRQEGRVVERIVRFSTSLVMVANKKRVFVCLEDVTKRKKSALALQKSEDLFRRTFDQSPIGAAMVGLDHRFLKVNQELCRITGYTAEELLNLRFPEITCADDLDSNLKQAKDLAQGLIDQYEMDKRYIRKDGKQVWVRLSVRLIRDSQGRPLYSLPMMVEVDDRIRLEKEKEAQLELFRLINENGDLKTMVERVVTFLKTWSCVDAIAIRLWQGNDFPYYQTVGFSEEFICRENSMKSMNYNVIRSAQEREGGALECVCGCVIATASLLTVQKKL